MKQIAFVVLLCIQLPVFSQNIGIGTPTPDASAQLDVSAGNKGLLIPRVALTSVSDASTISNPANSLLVYNNGTGGLSPAGYYYNSGTTVAPNWTQLVTPATTWSLTGNAGTVDGTHFIGTTDNVPVSFRVNNLSAGTIGTNATFNTFFGLQSGAGVSTGTGNAGLGAYALGLNAGGNENVAVGASAMQNNTTGNQNTAIGYGSLLANTGRNGSTAIGYLAMRFAYNTTVAGNTNNTAVGKEALRGSLFEVNNTGVDNTVIGASAMLNNTSGSRNTVAGTETLFSNTTGSDNSASGYAALSLNTLGNGNTAIGSYSLSTNVTRSGNTAVGFSAMRFADDAVTSVNSANTAVGSNALYGSAIPAINTGVNNTAIGANAMLNTSSGSNNTALGVNTLNNNSSGGNNTAIGQGALLQNSGGSGNVALGYQAGGTETSSNKLYIENSNANKDNALIYGDFAGDSLNLNGKINIRDFTRLGTQASGAPAIKMKKLTTTLDGNANGSVAHGLTESKILSIRVRVTNGFNSVVFDGSTIANNSFNAFVNAGSVVIQRGATFGDLIGRPAVILITYEE